MFMGHGGTSQASRSPIHVQSAKCKADAILDG